MYPPYHILCLTIVSKSIFNRLAHVRYRTLVMFYRPQSWAIKHGQWSNRCQQVLQWVYTNLSWKSTSNIQGMLSKMSFSRTTSAAQQHNNRNTITRNTNKLDLVLLFSFENECTPPPSNCVRVLQGPHPHPSHCGIPYPPVIREPFMWWWHNNLSIDTPQINETRAHQKFPCPCRCNN